MAELTTFGFRSGHTLLHQADVRFKILFVALISGVNLNARPAGLVLLTLIVLSLICHIRIPVMSALREMRYFILLLAFVFSARALSTPGIPVWMWHGITITRQGLYEGSLVCWRLAAVVLLGLSFVATTRPSEIRGAVEWGLRPLPWVPEKRVGIMISLLIRFIPLILNQALETGEVQRARGIECRKNPIYRLSRFTIPFLRRTFQDADRLVIAMEARCYSENRTPAEFTARKQDWIALITVVGLCGLILFF